MNRFQSHLRSIQLQRLLRIIVSTAVLFTATMLPSQALAQDQGQQPGPQQANREPIVAFSGEFPDFGSESSVTSCPSGYFGLTLGSFPSSQPRIWQAPAVSGLFFVTGAQLRVNAPLCSQTTPFGTFPGPFGQTTTGFPAPGPGSAEVSSQTSFSLKNGEIVLESLVQTSVLNQPQTSSVTFTCSQNGCTAGTPNPAPAPGTPLPGDLVSVGLANGTDRSNAIEIAGFSISGSVICRTVAGGVATETTVPLAVVPNSFGSGGTDQYEIVAKSGVVSFYINGNLVATHTTNIPTTALNTLFSLSSTGSGGGTYLTESLNVSGVSFKQRP